MTTDTQIISDALGAFVTVLLDGAWDTEGESAHLDVIALCYVMPDSATENWKAWPDMWRGWVEDGRRPAGVGRKTPGPCILGRHYRYTPYAHRWWNSTREAADHVAKVIADGLDDELLVFCYGDDDDWDGCTVEDAERLKIVTRLAAIAGPEKARLLDHIERELDRLDEHDRKTSRAAILSYAPATYPGGRRPR